MNNHISTAASSPPLYTPGLGHDKIMLATETMAHLMSSEGHQLQRGLECNGYSLWGPKLPNGESDTRRILDQTNPSTVVVQDKREWDPVMGGCFDKTVAFTNTSMLAERPDIFKVTICRDAHQNPDYHCQAHAEIGCHAWIICYHPDTICKLAPWLRREHLIRTYQSIDSNEIPSFVPPSGRKGAVLSGALSNHIYPLRTRLAQAIARERMPNTEYLIHPGYHACGSTSVAYLQSLSRFKVSICTASIYGYALRKLIESTACGNVVITDLPQADRLPGIDGNLVRVSPEATVAELRDVVQQAVADYDPERQREYARRACDYYHYTTLYAKLASEIELMRTKAAIHAP